MTPIYRVEDALQACKGHSLELRKRASKVEPHVALQDLAVQNYLVNYLLGVIYAELEQAIKRLVVERLSRTDDVAILNFAREAAPMAVKGLKMSNLSGHLNKFNPKCQPHFGAWCGLPENGQATAAWDNLLTNRHSFAHGGGSQQSLEDVEASYREAFRVIERFEEALALS